MNKLTVLLLSCLYYASFYQVRAERPPVTCYDCSTERYDYYCGDPFNKTVSGMRTTTCKQACAKWVKRPRNGPVHIVRTCADALEINMKWGYVCMKESRPGDGKLCFCDDDYCNTAPSWGHLGYARLLVYLCIAAIVWGVAEGLGDMRLMHFMSYNQHLPHLPQISTSSLVNDEHWTTNIFQVSTSNR